MKAGKLKPELFGTVEASDGVRVPYLFGDTESVTDKIVVFAHGVTVDKNEYAGILTRAALEFRKAGLATLRFDFRGHGDSKVPQEEMTPSGEVMDLEAVFALAKELGFKGVGLLGASFGGMTSVLFTARHPESVKALVLWNPAMRVSRRFSSPLTPWEKKYFGAGKLQEVREKGWIRIGSKGYKIGRECIEEIIALDVLGEARRITCPTLLLHGDKDDITPLSDSEAALESVKGARLEVIKGAGHGFHEGKNDPAERIATRKSIEWFREHL